MATKVVTRNLALRREGPPRLYSKAGREWSR